MTINSDFNRLPWHDAVINVIEIDRRAPGERDAILMKVEWPDGGNSDLNFSECYSLRANMNFGIVAEETIRSAEELADHELINALRVRWPISALPSDLRCYVIETNSTASTIEICARSFDLRSAQVIKTG